MTDKLREEAQRLTQFVSRLNSRFFSCLIEREEVINRSDSEIYSSLVSIRKDALEEAAMLYQDVNPASDMERHNGDPGAGAMGAVIEYRDKIRKLKVKP